MEKSAFAHLWYLPRPFRQLPRMMWHTTRKGIDTMNYGVGGVGGVDAGCVGGAGYGGGWGGCGGGWGYSSMGAILVLFILLVIISRAFLY